MATMIIELYDSTTTWRDVSSSVISSGDVTINSMNKEYSTSARGFTFVVSQTYATSTHITTATQVRFKINGGVRFWGNVLRVNPIDRNTSWEVETEHRIMNLKKYLLDYDTLHTRLSLAGSPDYIASDNFTYPNAKLSHILTEMWYVAGLGTLYTNNINNEYVVKSKSVLLDDGVTPGTEDFIIDDIRIDENTLYGINQAFAGNHLTSSYDGGNGKITFFDFFQLIFSLFGITLECDNGDWELHSYANGTATGFTDPTYTISDDDVYRERERNDITARANYYKDTRLTGSRAEYSISGSAALTEVFVDNTSSSYDDSPDNMDIPSGIVFLLQAQYGGSSAGDVYKWDVSTTWDNNVLHIGNGIFGLRRKNNLILDFNTIKRFTSLDNVLSGGHVLDIHEVSINIKRRTITITEAEFT